MNFVVGYITMINTVKKVQQNIYFIKKRKFFSEINGIIKINNELLQQQNKLNAEINQTSSQIENFSAENNEISELNNELNNKKSEIEEELDEYGIRILEEQTHELQSEISKMNEQMQTFEEEKQNLQNNINTQITTVAMQNINLYSDIGNDYFYLVKLGPVLENGESITFDISSPVRIIVPYKFSDVEKFNSKHMQALCIKIDELSITFLHLYQQNFTKNLSENINVEPINVVIGIHNGFFVVYFKKYDWIFTFETLENVFLTQFYIIPPEPVEQQQNNFIYENNAVEFEMPRDLQFGSLSNLVEQKINEMYYSNMFFGKFLKGKNDEIISLEYAEGAYCKYYFGILNCYSYLDFEYNIEDVYHIKVLFNNFTHAIIKFTKMHIEIDNMNEIPVPVKQTKMRISVYETDNNNFFLTLEIDQENNAVLRKELIGINNEFELDLVMYVDENIVGYKQSERVPKYIEKSLNFYFEAIDWSSELNSLVENGYLFKCELLKDVKPYFKLIFDVQKKYEVNFEISIHKLIFSYDPDTDYQTGLKIMYSYDGDSPVTLDFEVKNNDGNFNLYLSNFSQFMICSFDDPYSLSKTNYAKKILDGVNIYQTAKITTVQSEFEKLELPIMEPVYNEIEEIETFPLQLNEYFYAPTFTGVEMQDTSLTNCFGIQNGGYIKFSINNQENNIFEIADFECKFFKLVLYDDKVVVDEIICENGVITPILQNEAEIISKTVFGIEGENDAINFEFNNFKFYVSGQELALENNVTENESLLFDVELPSVKIFCMNEFYAATL